MFEQGDVPEFMHNFSINGLWSFNILTIFHLLDYNLITSITLNTLMSLLICTSNFAKD